VLALANPSVEAYDPAFAYEIAVIVREGLRRMLEDGDSVIYYLTIMNEFYTMPPQPRGVEEDILKGLYRFKASSRKRAKLKAHLLGSGTLMNEALKAGQILENDFDLAADVWSVTSYQRLLRDALDSERWNLFHPGQPARRSHLESQLGGAKGVFVAASDYIKALPATIAKWVPGRMLLLGTDGYGRSDDRAALRDFFEVDARHIAYAALSGMVAEGHLKPAVLDKARKSLDIDPDRPNPMEL
jgi:pyruvate dehydrogenase E1 component